MSDMHTHSALDRPENFINRELSWIEFNYRVLEEALDSTQPLLERVRFLSIFGTNLDEFFEVRVAGLKQQIESKSGFVGADHLTAAEIIAAASKRVRELIGHPVPLLERRTRARARKRKTSSSTRSPTCRPPRWPGPSTFSARNCFPS